MLEGGINCDTITGSPPPPPPPQFDDEEDIMQQPNEDPYAATGPEMFTNIVIPENFVEKGMFMVFGPSYICDSL